MKKTFVTLALVLLLVVPIFALVALPAQAQVDPFGNRQQNINDALGLGNRDPRDIGASVLNILMGFLGIIAVVIILIGGFKWMTAAGDESKVEEAKKLMTAGVIGLVIILAAWGVTIFVMQNLLNATGANTVL